MPDHQLLEHRSWRWLLTACAVASVVPLWCARFLPFSDMPEQVAVIATLRHYWDASWNVRGEYVVALGQSQYLLYHVVAALLSVVTDSAELANRILLTLTGLAFPCALRSLLRAFGRDPRLALFGVPAFWSRPLTMGFVPYVVSVPVVLWALALAVRQAESPTRRRAIGLCAVSVALFYLHANAYVLFLLGAFGVLGGHAIQRIWRMELGARKARALAETRALLRMSVWVLPSAICATAWTLRGAIAPQLEEHQVLYVPLRYLLAEFPRWSHDIWRSHWDEGCAIVVWTAFAVLLVQRGARQQRGRAWIAAIPFACAVLTYLALPYSVGVGVMLNVRVAVFVAVLAPLLLDTVRGTRATVPLLAVACANLVLAGDAAYEVHRVETDELGDVDRLLLRMEPDTRVVTLPFHLSSHHTHWAPWTFFGSYARSRHGGIAGFSFSEISHWPIHYREEIAPPKKSVFWTFDACRFRNEVDGRYYDYVLARGDVDPFRDAPPGPRWRKVDSERDFTLYAKVPGENPAWIVDDGGPCESRRSLEANALTSQRRDGLRAAP